MEHPDSPPRPRQRRRMESQQEEQDVEEVMLVADGNHPATTIYDLHEDLLGLTHALLGNGHFRYHSIACKMFLKASKLNPGYKKITTGKNVTSSISCARKYFEDKGTDTTQLRFFWFSAARHGRVEVMQLAHKDTQPFGI